MRTARFSVFGGAMLLGLALGGCQPATQTDAQAKPAAIPAGQEDRTASSPSSPNSLASQANPERKSEASKSGPNRPVVEIQTTLGTITVELDPEEAPLTVANFLRYVEGGHYEQTIFHQVLKGYVIMGGGFGTDLREKRSHPPIRNEAQRCKLKNVAGTIAMVRRPDVTDSATCQFYINVADNPNLDHRGTSPEEYGYCPFGRVISGMEVVRKIADVEVIDLPDFERIPKQHVVIQSVRRVR